MSQSKLSRSSNQYKSSPDEASFVQDLLENRVSHVWDDNKIICCYKPTGPGISSNAGGYMRVNYKGRKILCHVIVHSVMNKGVDEEVSHLCNNAWCCNPRHLIHEERKKNISRRGCPGTVKVDDDLWVQVCTHSPCCRVTTKGVRASAPIADTSHAKQKAK